MRGVWVHAATPVLCTVIVSMGPKKAPAAASGPVVSKEKAGDMNMAVLRRIDSQIEEVRLGDRAVCTRCCDI